MNVITSNPILQMSSFEGNKNDVARVRAFQFFVKANDKSSKVIINGIWDEATSEASKIWGEKFDKITYKDQNFVNKINERINAPTSKGGTNTDGLAGILAGLKTTETTIDQAKTTLTDDEKKARNMKIIATTGGAVVGFAIAKWMMKTQKPMILIGLTLIGAGAGFMVSKMMKKK